MSDIEDLLDNERPIPSMHFKQHTAQTPQVRAETKTEQILNVLQLH